MYVQLNWRRRRIWFTSHIAAIAVFERNICWSQDRGRHHTSHIGLCIWGYSYSIHSSVLQHRATKKDMRCVKGWTYCRCPSGGKIWWGEKTLGSRDLRLRKRTCFFLFLGEYTNHQAFGSMRKIILSLQFILSSFTLNFPILNNEFF